MGSKWFKVQMRDSVQLQMALNGHQTMNKGNFERFIIQCSILSSGNMQVNAFIHL